MAARQAHLWLVSGAHKGVGKTTLARALGAMLPDACCAKLGHHAPQAGKPGNYFTDTETLIAFVAGARRRHRHVVVEACQPGLFPGTATRIFIEGWPGGAVPRRDAGHLRRQADIRVGGEPPVADGRRVLAQIPGHRAWAAGVQRCLEQQAAWVAEHRQSPFAGDLRVRSKVWLVSGERHVFGPGVAHLLRRIAEGRTLAGAARAEAMSYRYAWGVVREAERRGGVPLLLRAAGGRSGGRSQLTPAAEQWLRAYMRVEDAVRRVADREWRRISSRRQP